MPSAMSPNRQILGVTICPRAPKRRRKKGGSECVRRATSGRALIAHRKCYQRDDLIRLLESCSKLPAELQHLRSNALVVLDTLGHRYKALHACKKADDI